MTTQRRINASRANGLLSNGPKTLDGKHRSSQNSLRWGLTAECVLLPGESREGFQALFQQFLDRFDPVDDVEVGMIEEMTACYWRTRRAWAIENTLLAEAVDAQPPGTELHRLAAGFTTLAREPHLALLHRYETRLHLMHQRALHNLLLLRAAGMQNEPSPNIEHSHPLCLTEGDA